MERTEEVQEETTEPDVNTTTASSSGLEKDVSTLTLEVRYYVSSMSLHKYKAIFQGKIRIK